MFTSPRQRMLQTVYQQGVRYFRFVSQFPKLTKTKISESSELRKQLDVYLPRSRKEGRFSHLKQKEKEISKTQRERSVSVYQRYLSWFHFCKSAFLKPKL